MEKNNWRDNLIKIEAYVAGEQPTGKDVIKLNANENPYPPAPGVETAIKGVSPEALRKYPQIDSGDLRQALADYHSLARESVFAGNGSDEVLAFAFRGFFNSDRPILFPEISYSFYPVWCNMFNIPCKRPPLAEGLRIDPQDYKKDNGGVVIANPNAPTGLSLEQREIEDILKANKASIVIIDEAYVDFGAFSSVGLTEKYDNLLVVQTFSKGRSLAGARIGAAFGNPELIRVLDAVKDSFNSYPLDSIASAIGIASLADEAYFKKRIRQIVAARERTRETLEKMGFYATDSKSNFLFVKHPTADAARLQAYLKENGVLVRRFDQRGIEQFLRITVGTEAQMDRLLGLVEEYMRS
ncbi:MAG: histidinol-phosphate transaminase [Clostridiales Family XIII bacterium]|jgi:histidinol-phosphate aminotransferase|nr:histidinol-phosphate transaminase [Clostridiales Family XIII bacterium]